MGYLYREPFGSLLFLISRNPRFSQEFFLSTAALCAIRISLEPLKPGPLGSCLYYCSLTTMVPESQSCQARLPAVNPAQMNPRKAGRAETR